MIDVEFVLNAYNCGKSVAEKEDDGDSSCFTIKRLVK